MHPRLPAAARALGSAGSPRHLLPARPTGPSESWMVKQCLRLSFRGSEAPLLTPPLLLVRTPLAGLSDKTHRQASHPFMH